MNALDIMVWLADFVDFVEIDEDEAHALRHEVPTLVELETACEYEACVYFVRLTDKGR